MSEQRPDHSMPTADVQSDIKNPKIPRKYKAIAAAMSALILVGGLKAGAEFAHHSDQPTMDALRARNDQLRNSNKKLNQAARRFDRLSKNISRIAGTETDTVIGKKLKQPSELPGFDKKISPAKQELLWGATVKIYSQDNGNYFAPNPYCTGVKVNIEDKAYVMTAAHCIYDNLIPMGKGGSTGRTPKAFNPAKISTATYKVSLDQETPGSGNNLINVRNVSVMAGGADLALLEVEPSKEFDALPALTYRHSRTPEVGQQVAVYGEPTATNYMPVAAKGIYLGRLKDEGYQDRYVDLVGLGKLDDQSEDACLFGASGSAAVFADGFVSGALSKRNHLAYSKNVPENSGDGDPRSALYWRIDYEKKLGVDMSQFDTLCMYTVAKPTSTADLVAGFDISYQQYVSSAQGELAGRILK